MDRRKFLTTVGLMGAVALSGCGGQSGSEDEADTDDADTATDEAHNGEGSRTNGTADSDGQPERRRLPFRVGDGGFEVDWDGNFEELHVQGINMGMALPGRFPGEAAISRDQYARWFEQIGDLNANAIRVYTIHPPSFYEELAAHNRRVDDPLYLFHGTWISEGTLHEAGDVTAVSDEFHTELRRTVDVVHGEAQLEDRPGHASGRYQTDVSNYLLGYISGIEWVPSFVVETNEAGEDGEYDGRFIETVDESPFERWLAEALDVVATHAADEYGTQRPLAFVNWPTTDPLDHPYEPFENEDNVTVHPDAVVPTDEFEAGTFGAYHIYPYYPPFMNHTPEYVEYTDHRGEPNSYAGYLNDLQGALDVPLLVAEFGVPDSRSLAAENVHGRHQGRHTEREQGEIVAVMIEDIEAEGTAGGLLFTWQDEWFKRTWNLAPLSDPNRRPFWSNVQTPEQRFGLLTFDPAGKVSLDGSAGDWTDARRLSPTSGDAVSDRNGQRTLTSMAITHDAAYLSLRLEFESLAALDWSEMNVIVALGHTGRGSTSLPFGLDTAVDPTDFVIRLGGPGDSRVRVDAYYDSFAWRFGNRANLDLSAYRERDSGRFTPVRVSKTSGYEIPVTGERIPFESLETGELRYGNGNPAAESYDSLADVHVSRSADAIELRLPWLLLNVADPSQRRAVGDFWNEAEITFEQFDSLSIAAGTYAPRADGSARKVDNPTNLTHAVPGVSRDELEFVEYSWEPWRQPEYVERKKESYEIVQTAFDEDV